MIVHQYNRSASMMFLLNEWHTHATCYRYIVYTHTSVTERTSADEAIVRQEVDCLYESSVRSLKKQTS